jgi:hypothetical protein
MKISVIDGSNYFKGLLLLIRKDCNVTEMEIQLMKRAGRALGFENNFCDNAINEILINKYIVDDPPSFSTKELATKFIKDGLTIAFSDNRVYSAEKDWLLSIVERNQLDLTWFQEEFYLAANRKQLPSKIEVDDLSMGYF